jgi:hypothetical protein
VVASLTSGYTSSGITVQRGMDRFASIVAFRSDREV